MNNLHVFEKDYNAEEYKHQDIKDLLYRLGDGFFTSKLLFADLIRNMYIITTIYNRYNHINSPISWLDICSGESITYRMFINSFKEFKIDYNAIDMRLDVLQKLAEKYQEASFYQGDAIKIIKQFDKNKHFEVITSIEGPEHLGKDGMKEFFKIANEKLNIGGILIFATPKKRDNGTLQHPICHDFEMTIDDIKTELINNNFKINNIYGYRIKTRIEDDDGEYYIEDVLSQDEMKLFEKFNKFINYRLLLPMFVMNHPEKATNLIFNCVKEK